MINLFHLIEVCNEPGTLRVVLFIKKILNVVFTAIPIGLIIIISIDMFKNIIASNDEAKKNITKSIKRIIYCAIVFLVPTIINLMVYLITELDINIPYTECWKNADEIIIKEKEISNAEELVKKAETDQTYQSVSEAQTAVSQITDNTKKEEFQKKLNELREKIDKKYNETINQDEKTGGAGR